MTQDWPTSELLTLIDLNFIFYLNELGRLREFLQGKGK